MTTTTPNHYVNNKDFHQGLIDRKGKIDEILILQELATVNDLLDHETRKKILKDNFNTSCPLPQISNYIGECFLKMATNIAHKHNFNRYPYKEEMISDGIVDCIKYVDSFDTGQNNPFAYFTQAINNAFVRRIIKEKKQAYVKVKLLSSSTVDIHELQEQDEDGEFINAFKDYMNSYNNFDGSIFEKKKKEHLEKPYTGMTIEEFEGE